MNNMWYLEKSNMFSLVCPHKFSEYQEDHQFKQYKKGEFIYFSDDPSNTIYLVAEGKVKILYYSEDGEEIAKSVLSRGELFGELALLGEESRKDYAQSMSENTLICVITLDQMGALMKDDTRFALHINRIIGLRIRKLERKLESLVFKDVRTRVLEFLRDFAVEKGEQEGNSFTVHHFLTHKDIADLVGTTRQTVTTLLNDLRNEGLITFSRKTMQVSDIRKLDIGSARMIRSAS